MSDECPCYTQKNIEIAVNNVVVVLSSISNEIAYLAATMRENLELQKDQMQAWALSQQPRAVEKTINGEVPHD